MNKMVECIGPNAGLFRIVLNNPPVNALSNALIKELTNKGLDVNRRRFAPYSEGYISKLQREGKSTRVDLKYSNDMMNSLTGKVQSNKKAIVFFNRGEMRERALFNQFLK